MSAGFTKGPWGVETFQTGEHFIGPLRSSGTLADIVAEVDNSPDYTAEAQARKLANARLIAAAPALYGAGQSLLEAAERHIFGDECKAERDAFRTALKLARGEEA